jgi:predicted nucleic acid-binding protein
MTPRLLDTCIVIDFLRRKPDATAFIRNLDQIPFLSAITVAELYGGVREGDERRKLDKLVNAFHTVSVTEDIGRRGGLHRRQYCGSHGTDLADALIAATAESLGADLVTLNKKHFPMISRLVVPY